MKRFLLPILLLASIAHAGKGLRNATNSTPCTDFMSTVYNGYVASRLNLVPQNQEAGNFSSLALRTSDPNLEATINAFPSLRNTPAAKMALKQKGELFVISDYFPVNDMELGDPVRRRRANCLVSALAWFGLTENLDLYHEDFSKILEDNFDLLAPGKAQTPIPPETMVTFCGKGSGQWMAIHAAVYLGDNILWNKYGIEAPAYTPLEKVMRQYGVTGRPDDKMIMRFFKLKR